MATIEQRRARDPEESFAVDEHGNMLKPYGPSPSIPSLSMTEPAPETAEDPPWQWVLPWELSIAPETIRLAPQDYATAFSKATFGPSTSGDGRGFWAGINRQLGGAMSSIGHAFDDSEAVNEPAPESVPLIQAIDSGYVDKKFFNPVKAVREGIAKDDMALVEKGHKKLVDLLSDTGLSWGQRFADLYFRTGIQARARDLASKIASDIVMKEFLRPGSTQAPRALGAVQAGLISPSELIPGEQTQPGFAHLIPAEPLDVGEPQASVELFPTPAQPGQRPAASLLVPGARLNVPQEALMASRLESLSKAQRGGQPPAGLAEFQIDLQARLEAFQEQNKRPPSATEYSNMVTAALGRYEKEPRPGSLSEQRLAGQILGERATTEKTIEQTQTERQLRPHQITEAQARTTNLLAAANEHMTRASDAVRRGEIAEQRVELERAARVIQEAVTQGHAILLAILETDLPKEDRVKAINAYLRSVKAGMELLYRGGLLGTSLFDIGKPNVQIQPGTSIAPGTVVPPQEALPKTGQGFVDPFQFAPSAPGGRAIVPTPLPPTQPPEEALLPRKLTPEEEEYNKLRRSGLTKEQAIAEMERRRKKE